jgi:hypothetical protein
MDPGWIRVLLLPILHLWSKKFQSFFCDVFQFLNEERKTAASQHFKMMFDDVTSYLSCKSRNRPYQIDYIK